jgi:hypothetical protein
VDNSVTYQAVLPCRRETVAFVAELLRLHRLTLGTRAGRRALDCFAQAVLVLRWYLDGTRVLQLARDNGIGRSTAYDYLHEGLYVLARRRPTLRGALIAALAAGYSHVIVDGTVLGIDRLKVAGPNGADLWWSGKHKHHGGNVQVVSAPDGWPLWTSDVRPGREHDTTCFRSHDMPATLAEAVAELPALADLGYEGEADLLTVANKKPARGKLNIDQQTFNTLHAALRAIGERANTLLKTTFKALRRVSLDPSRIGDIVGGALVLLHIEHNRTT